MDDFRDKSSSASRKGKAAELLVAAHCILVSGGQLNVSTSYVDDEGVDLVFHARGSAAILAVQVKTRFTTSSVYGRGQITADVRAQTFAVREDLAMLFAVVDDQQGRLVHVWLVPSADFAAHAMTVGAKQKLRFAASTRADSADKWTRYRLEPAQLPARVLEILTGLDASGR